MVSRGREGRHRPHAPLSPPREGLRGILPALLLPALIALGAALSALTFAGLSMAFSTAPGWRALRWYSLAALLSAMFTAGDAITTLDVPAHWYASFARVNFFLAGLHGACWYAFDAAQRERALSRWERAVVGAGLFAAVASLVPGVVITEQVVSREVAWLGVTYRDVIPTSFGSAVSVFYASALAALALRTIRSPGPGGRAQGVALLLLALASVNDAVVFTFALPAPYLLSLGFFSVVVGVGASVSARFVQNARALETALRALRDTREALVRQERLAALGEMSAMVAHEVRNPIAVMFNALSTVRRGALDAQQAMLLEIVDEEARRLQRLVTDLLDFSRPASLRAAETDVASLVATAVEAARASAHELPDAPEIEQRVPDATCPVRVDPELCRRALINLLDNALRAPGCRRVRVSADCDGDALTLRVCDDGEGVPESLREKVFAPFYSSRPAGTGLGLAIVRNVALAHGGSVSCSAAEGGGASFSLCIPRAPSASP